MSSGFRPSSASRSASHAPAWSSTYRYASAVIAKPLGTCTPCGVSLRYISPSEAFLPPTSGDVLDADLLEGAQIAFHGANHAVSLFVRPRSRAICQRSSPAHLSSSIRSYRDGHVGSDDEQIAGSVKAC